MNTWTLHSVSERQFPEIEAGKIESISPTPYGWLQLRQGWLQLSTKKS